jgi:DnaJ-class molecular chaperone
MICSKCGGSVEWKDPLTNLTHTQCARCRAVNCQAAEDDYETPEEMPETCGMCNGYGFIDGYDEEPTWYKPGEMICCPECGGTGEL